MVKTNPGVYKYRDYGVYLYESGGMKKAIIFFSGRGMETMFTADTWEKAYQKAVNEIDSYLLGNMEGEHGKD